MLFSGLSFLFFFLPLTLAVCRLVPEKRKTPALFLLSLLFYAAGELRFLPLLLFSALLGWVCGLGMHRGKWVLILGLSLDLALLLFFKYGQMLGFSGIPLPLGISFYTFQNMSYLIDVYRKRHPAERHFLPYATYLTLFPQLVAGPIVRFCDIQKELNAPAVSAAQRSDGVMRFCIGLGKKVLLANPLGTLVILDAGSVLGLWLRAAAYALQIYFDFSGYSDMAIGLGKLLGFTFPENFDHPYLSRSVTEFWRRWHMTLGSWFRDYVYIPLGGNRRHRVPNILLVWALTGLWHGASLNFMFWGIYYGVLLLLEKYWYGNYLTGRLLPHLYVTLVTVLGFVLFRCTEGAGRELAAMLGFGGLPFCDGMTLYTLRRYAILLILSIFGATDVLQRLPKKAECLRPVFVGAVLLLSTAYLVDGSFNPFLYFRF